MDYYRFHLKPKLKSSYFRILILNYSIKIKEKKNNNNQFSFSIAFIHKRNQRKKSPLHEIFLVNHLISCIMIRLLNEINFQLSVNFWMTSIKIKNLSVTDQKTNIKLKKI